MGHCLVLFLTLFPIFAFADELTVVPVVAHAVEPAPIRTPTFGVRDLRAWSAEDASANIREAFQLWRTCQQARVNWQSLPESCYCAQTGAEVVDFPINFIGMPSCLPDQRDQSIVYNENLTDEEKVARDDLICECFSEGRSFEIFGSNPPSRKNVQEIGRHIQSRISQAGLSQEEEQEFQLNYSTAINAMSFADSSARAERLGGIYIADDRRISRSRNNSGRFNIESNIQSLLDLNNVTGNQCIPYADFLLHAQFSEDPYIIGAPGAITGAFDGEFNEDDWDYRKLLERLGNVQTYDGAHANAQNQATLARMRFLHNNPAFKNLFASDDTDSLSKKRELFGILKNHYPRPLCADIGCVRNDDWARQVGPFRERISRFLSDGDVNDDIQTGIKRISELAVAANQADVAIRAQNPVSENLGPNPLEATPTNWRAFCEFRSNPGRQQVRSNSVNLALLLNIEQTFGRSFTNPMADDHYRRMNAAYCERPRRASNGTGEMTFAAFKPSCGTQSHRSCLQAFVRAYPNPTGQLELDTNINDLYLREGVLSPVVERERISRMVAIGGSPELRRSSMQELSTGVFSGSSSSAPGRMADTTVVRPTTAEPRNNPRAETPQTNPSPDILSVVPGFVPTVNPAPVIVPTPVTTVREQIRETESEAQLLREEITSLRGTLERESGRPQTNRNDGLIQSLNERITSMEREVAQKEREAQELRRVATQTDRQDRNSPQADDEDRRVSRRPASVGRSLSPQETQTLSPASTGGVNGGASVPPAGGGAASLGSTGAGSRARGGGNIPTTKTRDASVGAITVSDAATTDYQNLRSQASGEAVTGSLPIDSYDRLVKSGDTSVLEERYRDQLPAAVGEVRRFEIVREGTRERVEILVSRTANGLSVTFAQGRSIASEEVPERVLERTVTRDNLVQELENR